MLLTALLGKAVAAKVAVGLAGLTMTGTVVAAEAGVLPDPVQRVAHQVAGGLGVPAPEPDGEEAPDDPVTPEPAPTPEPTPTPDPEPLPTPEVPADKSPNGKGPDGNLRAFQGLCQAYLSGGHRDSTAQRALAAAAGGPHNVEAYCAQVLAEKSGKNRDKAGPTPPTPAPDSQGKPARQKADKPTLEEPASGNPASGNPASGTPVARKPATDKPATGKPATADPK